MKENEAETVLAMVKDKLQRHVSCVLTPELATGIYHTLRHDVAAMVDAQKAPAATARKSPARKKTAISKTTA